MTLNEHIAKSIELGGSAIKDDVQPHDLTEQVSVGLEVMRRKKSGDQNELVKKHIAESAPIKAGTVPYIY